MQLLDVVKADKKAQRSEEMSIALKIFIFRVARTSRHLHRKKFYFLNYFLSFQNFQVKAKFFIEDLM